MHNDYNYGDYPKEIIKKKSSEYEVVAFAHCDKQPIPKCPTGGEWIYKF